MQQHLYLLTVHAPHVLVVEIDDMQLASDGNYMELQNFLLQENQPF